MDLGIVGSLQKHHQQLLRQQQNFPLPMAQQQQQQQQQPPSSQHLQQVAAAGGFSDQVSKTDLAALLCMLDENRSLNQLLKFVKMENARVTSQLSQMEGVKEDAEGNREDSSCKSRYWTDEEHQLFLEAVSCFGLKDVKAISLYVGTRNATQVRTHAQKFTIRMQKKIPGFPEGFDLSSLAPALRPTAPEQLLYDLYTRSGGTLGIPPPAGEGGNGEDDGGSDS